jgi:SAM-dependent methyltransferase
LVSGTPARSRRRLAAALTLAILAFCVQAQDAEVRPPFVATPEEAVDRMLALARVGAGDFVIDLGSGDGRIVIAAARKFGARGLGVDLDASLVALSREKAREAGVAEQARFEERDVLRTDLSGASVVTIYLLPSLVDQLQPKLLAEMQPGSRIVAHAFPMKGWKPDGREYLRIAAPRGAQSGESELFLWIVPAQARGLWRVEGWQLRIEQNFQEIDVELTRDGAPLTVARARLEGRELEFSGSGFSFRGRVADEAITGVLVDGAESIPMTWTRP